jgi:solute carrier family 25 protein 44
MGLEKRSSIKQVTKDLIKEDGWKGLYRGFGPRFFSMSAWGTSMILTYEYLSKISSSLGLYYLFVYLQCCFCLRYLFVFDIY